MVVGNTVNLLLLEYVCIYVYTLYILQESILVVPVSGKQIMIQNIR